MIPVELERALQVRGGVVTTEDTRSCGVQWSLLRQLLASGDLVRIRPGTYSTPDRVSAAPSFAEREWLRARAAGAAMDVGHVFSHDSAAHALGLVFLSPLDPKIHVTRPVNGGRNHTGVHHHTAVHQPEQVVMVEGLPVLDVSRTAVDLARHHGVRIGLTACDSALRLGATRESLREACAPMRHWRGVRAARQAVELADAGAENPAESLTRLLLAQACGFAPITQFPMQIDGRVAWLDVLVGPHGVEFDGRQKYRRVEDGGVAGADPGDVVWRERQRERHLLEAGIGISRLVWDDLLSRNWVRSRARVAAEIEASVQRFGHATPAHLLEFARAMEPVRQRRIFQR